MTRLLNLLFASALLLLLSTASGAWAKCSASNKCGSHSPCCSSEGHCGSTVEHCLAGCNPTGSYSFESCAAMPVCQDQFIDFRRASGGKPIHHYVPLPSFSGDANQVPLTLDDGSTRSTSEGLVLELSKSNQGGTVLSSTRYMWYGEMTAVMKHDNNNGIVAAFYTMSPTADEIDWELTTSKQNHVETNWFWTGQTNDDRNERTLSMDRLPKGFSTADFHAYTVRWTPESITWLIDGTEVRIAKRKGREFPATPSRIQLSIWCAGCDGNEEGTREWAGGRPDWSKVDSKGTFTVTVRSLAIKCDTPSSAAGFPALAYTSGKDPSTGENKVVGTHRKTTM